DITHKHTHTHTETDRHTDRHTHTERHTHTDRQTDRQTHTQKGLVSEKNITRSTHQNINISTHQVCCLYTVISGLLSAPEYKPHALNFLKIIIFNINKPHMSISRRCLPQH